MKKLVMFLAISFLTGSFVGNVDAQGEVEGEWKIVKGMLNGQDVPTSILNTMSLKIERGSFTAKSGEAMSKGKVDINGTETPKQATFAINDGSDAGRELKAIFKFERNLLNIAFSQNEEFPSDFASTDSNRNLVLTYQATSGSRAVKGRGGKKLHGLPASAISGS